MFHDKLDGQSLYPEIVFVNRVVKLEGYTMHTHEFAEIVFVISGLGLYRVDNETFDIKTGDLIIINPGAAHTAIVTDSATQLTLFSICFDHFQLEGMPPNHLLLPDDTIFIHTTGQFHKDVSSLCEQILEEKGIKMPGRAIMQRNILSCLIITIIRYFETIKEEPVKNTRSSFPSCNKSFIIKQIKEYIDSHYADSTPLEDIYKDLYMTPSYIRKVFRDSTGQTPNQYLITVRLRIARQILSNNPSITVKETAYRVGYHDVFHFSKIFKKHFGVPPTFYK